MQALENAGRRSWVKTYPSCPNACMDERTHLRELRFPFHFPAGKRKTMIKHRLYLDMIFVSEDDELVFIRNQDPRGVEQGGTSPKGETTWQSSK